MANVNDWNAAMTLATRSSGKPKRSVLEVESTKQTLLAENELQISFAEG